MAHVTIKTADGTRPAEAEAGARLDDVVLAAGVLLDRLCSGRGTCGKCRVKATGALSSPTPAELRHLAAADREKGMRLACQARVQGPVEVEIEAARIFTDKTFAATVDLAGLSESFGLAIDLGTTTVAVFLVGLESDTVYAGAAVLNQQAAFGAEVMSRLLVAEKDNSILRQAAWSSIGEAAAGLELDEGGRARVQKAVVVGNSAMHHLALGLPPATLLRSPFEPQSLSAVAVASGELAALFPALAEIRFPPLIGGFVGSDALACLMYFGLGRDGENTLALDLGTNGEVMLAARGRVLAASTAAGPAFEGVNITCGMRAIAGAVTAARFAAGRGLEFTTVGNAPARGLAGSGLLSAVRLLGELGMILPSGRIAAASSEPSLKIESGDGQRKIALGQDLSLTQNDVRELQKAKAAVRAAIEVLLERAGICARDLSRVILTGSFGGRLDPADVLGLGVVPPLTAPRIYSIPNGAGLGAAMMLSEAVAAEARELAERVEHVELNLDKDFMDRFIAGMTLFGPSGRGPAESDQFNQEESG